MGIPELPGRGFLVVLLSRFGRGRLLSSEIVTECSRNEEPDFSRYRETGYPLDLGSGGARDGASGNRRTHKRVEI